MVMPPSTAWNTIPDISGTSMSGAPPSAPVTTGPKPGNCGAGGAIGRGPGSGGSDCCATGSNCHIGGAGGPAAGTWRYVGCTQGPPSVLAPAVSASGA